MVERLEDRRLLATLVVNTTADSLATDGFCSLREAIINSNSNANVYADCTAVGAYGADVIDVTAPGTYALSIPGRLEDAAATGDLDLTDPAGVTILGGGPASTIIDAAGIDRVFDIAFSLVDPVAASFSGLTITGGIATDDSTPLGGGAGQGGGIFNDSGNISLSNVEVSGNEAIGNLFSDGQGGGIFTFLGTVEISDAVISSNTAMGGASGAGKGGGIFADTATFTRVSNTTIRNNNATGGTDNLFLLAGEGFGGGIFSTASTWDLVVNTTISGNTATGGSGISLPGGTAQGGGIYSDDTWCVENITISGNTVTGGASPGPGGDARGGGWFVDLGGSVSLVHGTIAFNEASGGVGGVDGLGTAGGVYVAFGGSVSSRGAIIANNVASIANADVEGVFASLGFNLVGDGSGSSGFSGTDDQVGNVSSKIDPLLGPLQDNGGATKTHALSAGSPAIDAAGVAMTVPVDQRGVPRPLGAALDIGAFESGLLVDIDIEKLVSVDGGTTFVMANAAPGPVLLGGGNAPEFRYLLTNGGNVPLEVTLTDSALGTLIPPTPGIGGGDIDNNGLLDVSETWTITAVGSWDSGQNTNTATALGRFLFNDGASELAVAINDANYFGAEPAVDLEKLTNGEDADVPPGPQLPVGSTVMFDYLVTNPGNVALSNVMVTDDQGLVVSFVGGDTNSNGLLDVGETWAYTASSVVAEGQYANQGTVTADFADDSGRSVQVADQDVSHHLGMAMAGGGKQFFVVDKWRDKVFTYAPDGTPQDKDRLNHFNNSPRGTTMTADGETLWVIDVNKNVFVYDRDIETVGVWRASGVARPEGIATDGEHIWVVDGGCDRVFFYEGAATRRSGDVRPTGSFRLVRGNSNPKGITTDGESIWIVDDDRGNNRNRGYSDDKVFKYDTNGHLLAMWRIDDRNRSPRGITINPGDVNDIWIVDSLSNSVYAYQGGAFFAEGSYAADAEFRLSSDNRKPEGIADPPVLVRSAVELKTISEATPVAAGWLAVADGFDHEYAAAPRALTDQAAVIGKMSSALADIRPGNQVRSDIGGPSPPDAVTADWRESLDAAMTDTYWTTREDALLAHELPAAIVDSLFE